MKSEVFEIDGVEVINTLAPEIDQKEALLNKLDFYCEFSSKPHEYFINEMGNPRFVPSNKSILNIKTFFKYNRLRPWSSAYIIDVISINKERYNICKELAIKHLNEHIEDLGKDFLVCLDIDDIKNRMLEKLKSDLYLDY